MPLQDHKKYQSFKYAELAGCLAPSSGGLYSTPSVHWKTQEETETACPGLNFFFFFPLPQSFNATVTQHSIATFSRQEEKFHWRIWGKEAYRLQHHFHKDIIFTVANLNSNFCPVEGLLQHPSLHYSGQGKGQCTLG